MTRLIITGVSGFVSRHLLAYLNELQEDIEVLGLARSQPSFCLTDFPHLRCSYRQLDLLDRDAISDVIAGFRPTWIVHLAAYSSVGFSWQKPVESFTNNTNVLLNLIEPVRVHRIPCRILSVGSSEEYGNVGPASLPLREDAPLEPVSPYAVARVSQELLSKVYVSGYGLDIVMTRSFNHIGPYQRDVFVVPSLARQLCAIRYQGAPARLVTGDRTVIRDFVDVRDVVRAYHQLLLGGKAGEIYNVCSGVGHSIDQVLEMMQDILGIRAELELDPRLVRPSDNRVVVGARDKIRAEVGWEPQIPLRRSLEDILSWWSRG